MEVYSTSPFKVSSIGYCMVICYRIQLAYYSKFSVGCWFCSSSKKINGYVISDYVDKSITKSLCGDLAYWGHGHQDTMECVTMGMPIQDTRGMIGLLEAGRDVEDICSAYGAVGTLTPDGTTLDQVICIVVSVYVGYVTCRVTKVVNMDGMWRVTYPMCSVHEYTLCTCVPCVTHIHYSVYASYLFVYIIYILLHPIPYMYCWVLCSQSHLTISEHIYSLTDITNILCHGSC